MKEDSHKCRWMLYDSKSNRQSTPMEKSHFKKNPGIRSPNINLTHLAILLVVALALLSPLLLPGFPQTHDGDQHFVRTAHFFHAVKEGNLLPSWAGTLNSGFGSPVFLYNWLLLYYLSIPFLHDQAPHYCLILPLSARIFPLGKIPL